MKTESNPETKVEEANDQPWRKAGSQLVDSKEEVRPVITCECALWGSPCPHSFWAQEKSAAIACAN